MKVYQMIYTSVENCLAAPEIGLTNAPGLRVYSCSQGLSKNNIAELMRLIAEKEAEIDFKFDKENQDLIENIEINAKENSKVKSPFFFLKLPFKFVPFNSRSIVKPS